VGECVCVSGRVIEDSVPVYKRAQVLACAGRASDNVGLEEGVKY